MEILDKKQEWEEMGMIKYHVNKYIKERFYASMHIYTDGSKDPRTGTTGIGVYIPEFKISISKRLTSKLSIFTVEMVAIIIGLTWVEEVKPDRVVICSDSASVLTSLFTHCTSREDLMCEIFSLLWRIQRKGVVVGFCWVPAHVGVAGNESADELAKNALKREEIDFNVPLSKSEVKSIIKENIIKSGRKNGIQIIRGGIYIILKNGRY